MTTEPHVAGWKSKLSQASITCFFLLISSCITNSDFIVFCPYKSDGVGRYEHRIKVTSVDCEINCPDCLVSLQCVPAYCAQSFVFAEDPQFYRHHGVNWKRLFYAARTAIRMGKMPSGSSTITQQIVKNIYLSRDKTFIRKSGEILGAMIFDLFVDKSTQLELYLNIIEFGPSVYGIRNAATHFFHKDTKELTLLECAKLSSIITNPTKLHHEVNAAEPSELIRDRVSRNIKYLKKNHMTDGIPN